jgi:hypothetical protein
MISRGISRCLAAVLTVSIAWPTSVFAQASPAGVVTTLEGNVSARRATVASPVALKFKDDVFLQDTITTGDQSLARMLLGGRAVVTVRERSVLTITEVPGRSSIDLASGKFALAVAREKMRPGEEIQIRTPNAVAGVRGTVVITEVNRTTAQAEGPSPGVVTNFYVLRGSIAAGPLNQPGLTTVGPLNAARISGGAPPVLTPIPPEQIGQITAGLQPSTKSTGGAGQGDIKAQAVQTAVTLLAALQGDQAAFAPSAAPPVLRPEALSLPGQIEQTVIGQTGQLVDPLTSTTSLAGSELVTAITPTGPCTGCIRVSGVNITHSGSAFQSFSGVQDFSSSSLEVLGFDTSIVTHNGSSSFIDVQSGSALTLAGPLAALVDSTITTTGVFLAIDGSQVTNIGAAPLIALDPSFVSASGIFMRMDNSTLTLHGPLLATLGGAVSSGAGFDFLLMVSSQLTVSGTIEPLVRLTGTTASSGFHFVSLVNSSLALDSSPLLAVDGGQLTALNNILFAGTSSVTSSAASGLISLTNGAVVEATHFDAAGVISGSTLTLTAGPLLSVANSQLSARDLLFLQGTLTSGGPGALIGLTNGAVVNASLDVATLIPGSTMSVTGPLVSLNGASQLGVGNDVLSLDGATLTSSNPEDLVQILGGSALRGIGASPGRDVVHLSNGSIVLHPGGVVELVGSQLTRGQDVVHVASNSLMTASELFSAVGSTVSVGRDLVHVESGGRFIVSGELMELEGNNTVTIGGRLARATFGDPSNPLSAGGLVLVTGPIFEAFGAGDTVTLGTDASANGTIFGIPVRQANGGFVSIGPAVSFPGSGTPVFEADGLGSLVTINPLLLPNGPVINVAANQTLGGNTFVFFDAEAGSSSSPTATHLFSAALDDTQPGMVGQGIVQLLGPVVRVINATLNGAGGFSSVFEIFGTTLALGGSLLEVISGTLDNSGAADSIITMDGPSMIKTFGTSPLVAVSSGTLLTSSSLVFIGGNSLTDTVLALSAPFLVADGSLIGHPITPATLSPLIFVFEGTLISSAPQALVQLTNSTLRSASDFLQVGCGDSCGLGQVILAGPLLQATNSNVEVRDRLVLVTDEGTLVSKSASPLVSLTGGSHSLGVGDGSFFASSTFDVTGVNIGPDPDPDAVSLGLSVATDRSLQHGGVLFEASNGATITSANASAPQPFIQIDRALLEASAALVGLTSSTTRTTMTHHGDLLNLTSNAKLSAILPADALVRLDASTLNVNGGYVFGVKSGSFMSVTGALLSLANGSILNVNGAALLNVDTSLFKQSGPLVRFLGTGNVINVTNSTAPNLFLQGIPIFNSGGTITVTNPTPFVGLGTAGTININGVPLPAGATSATGSLIVVNNGTVKIGP